MALLFAVVLVVGGSWQLAARPPGAARRLGGLVGVYLLFADSRGGAVGEGGGPPPRPLPRACAGPGLFHVIPIVDYGQPVRGSARSA